MTSVRCIPWATERLGDAPSRVVRHRLGSGGMGLHRHEFIEAFWCEAGTATHVVNGRASRLAPGDLVCVRGDDQHGYADCDGFVMVNVSFMPGPVADLAARTGAGWPWRPGPMPSQRRLGAAAMARLAAWTDDLAQPGSGRLDLDAFLLDLARLWAAASGPDDDAPPPWLSDACAAFADPAHLRGGTTALCRLADRGAAHLNRQVRRWHGCTASELVARIRLDWAARELRLGDRPIGDIAAACGMPHLGHFYRRFHGRFGTTPRRWRMDARRGAGTDA